MNVLPRPRLYKCEVLIIYCLSDSNIPHHLIYELGPIFRILHIFFRSVFFVLRHVFIFFRYLYNTCLDAKRLLFASHLTSK
jgi:hypothetical protein